MRLRLDAKHIPVAATAVVAVLLYAGAALAYPRFFSVAVFTNLFADNAVLGIAALGMTFVILSGGIDLSVGSLVALTSMVLATLMAGGRVHPVAAMGLALAMGTLFGTGMGCLIRFYNLPPFLVTLAGMFLARGCAFVIRLESVPINHPWYSKAASI